MQQPSFGTIAKRIFCTINAAEHGVFWLGTSQYAVCRSAFIVRKYCLCIELSVCTRFVYCFWLSIGNMDQFSPDNFLSSFLAHVLFVPKLCFTTQHSYAEVWVFYSVIKLARRILPHYFIIGFERLFKRFSWRNILTPSLVRRSCDDSFRNDECARLWLANAQIVCSTRCILIDLGAIPFRYVS